MGTKEIKREIMKDAGDFIKRKEGTINQIKEMTGNAVEKEKRQEIGVMVIIAGILTGIEDKKEREMVNEQALILCNLYMQEEGKE